LQAGFRKLEWWSLPLAEKGNDEAEHEIRPDPAAAGHQRCPDDGPLCRRVSELVDAEFVPLKPGSWSHCKKASSPGTRSMSSAISSAARFAAGLRTTRSPITQITTALPPQIWRSRNMSMTRAGRGLALELPLPAEQ